MSTPEPTVRVTRYAVSAVPEDAGPDALIWEITVEYRGRGLWAVLRHGSCLSADGQWDWEMRPSEREDDWIDRHRFDEETALKLAREAAPHVTVNGHTVADAMARYSRKEQDQ